MLCPRAIGCYPYIGKQSKNRWLHRFTTTDVCTVEPHRCREHFSFCVGGQLDLFYHAGAKRSVVVKCDTTTADDCPHPKGATQHEILIPVHHLPTACWSTTVWAPPWFGGSPAGSFFEKIVLVQQAEVGNLQPLVRLVIILTPRASSLLFCNLTKIGSWVRVIGTPNGNRCKK